MKPTAMNSVEILAQVLANVNQRETVMSLAYWEGYSSIFVAKLQAPQRELIEKWRKEVDRLNKITHEARMADCIFDATYITLISTCEDRANQLKMKIEELEQALE